MSARPTQRPSATVLALGYAGLLPFVGCALAMHIVAVEQQGRVLYALLTYGATIVSFLGAIHWGLAMREPHNSTLTWVWGVLPSLVAWLALLLPPVLGAYVLAAALWTCLAVDRQVYPRYALQGWLPMRLVLTCIASAACVLGALALAP